MRRARLRIVGARCSICIIPIRKALEKAEGIKSVGANYITDMILVDYDEKLIELSAILSLVSKAGYEAIAVAGPLW